MHRGVNVAPHDEPEASGIAQPYDASAFEYQIEMIVGPDRRVRVDKPQAPGHAEMHDQRATPAIDEKVFTTAGDTGDGQSP